MCKSLKIIGISILILILCRGWIYRNLIHYSQVGKRESITITNKNLQKEIQKQVENKSLDIHQIADIATTITNTTLHFSTKKASRNPNLLYTSGKANCVGYAAMHNGVANYLIQQNKLSNRIKTQHLIGQIFIFGIDLHDFFDHPFFRDHDFTTIKDFETGETIFIDPSVSDYLRINSVTSDTK
ncbi:hypothetical protein [Aquimarina aquimarini]|uniref:hypothetical protein n=1 Tax=Aquimarina aquimarini TaxID=1191734 RepID=UPI001F2F7EE4|nr:hypothetical protein [Aquimarina aquimarini]